jgi:PAS domain S-box-containing protein
MRQTKIFSSMLKKIELIPKGYLVTAGVATSVIMTIVIVSVMSLLFHGKITHDLMITGIIASFLASLFVVYAISCMIDRLKERYEKITLSENYYHTLFESIKDCVCIISKDGNFVDVNKTMCEINGFASPAECIGTSFLNNVVDSPEKLSNALNRALKGETVHIEYKSVIKNGNELWWDSVLAPIKEPDGTIKNVLRISRDITEKKKTEERLCSMIDILERTKQATLNIMEDIQHETLLRKKTEESLRERTAQLEKLNRELDLRVREEVQQRLENEQLLIHQSRLAAMGEMIGMIAHQWRQPLNALGLIIQNIKDAYEYGELNKEHLNDNVKKGMDIIKHMSQTITDFRNFFRPDKEKTKFDVKLALANVLSMISAQLKAKNISYRITCHEHNKTFEDFPHVISCGEFIIEGYENELKQVFLNLISNAHDAIVESRAKGHMPADEKGHIDCDFERNGDKIVIRITDNAGGIPEEIIDRVFDPYFTTKEQGKGTGIGLYMSKMIIERSMGGKLTVKNVDGGAEFRIEV